MLKLWKGVLKKEFSENRIIFQKLLFSKNNHMENIGEFYWKIDWSNLF